VLVLVTGFEPFGGSAVNASEKVVALLEREQIAGLEIQTAVLPVEAAAGPVRLVELLDTLKPEAVLCLGEASRRAVLTVERVALNLLDYRIADNQGVVVTDQPVAADGPDAYFVSLPVREILEAVRAAGVPAELSLSAGTYLCNQVLYTMLHHLARRGRDIPAGFIHLPLLPEAAVRLSPPAASMDAATSLRGVCAALEVIAARKQG
jgi:pyroglutamyl-peptidase